MFRKSKGGEQVRPLRDRIDHALVRGQLSIILWLGMGALLIAIAATAVVMIFGLHGPHDGVGFIDAFWQQLVRTMDPGQITDDSGGFAIVSLVVTILGVLMVSTLISIVNTKVEQRIERVRRGRENMGPISGHIAVLGWSDIGAKVIEELAGAYPHGDPPKVVVLAATDVESIRHELMENPRIGRRLGRRWPDLRSGRVSDPRDLRRLASVHQSKAVIVLHDRNGEGVADTVKASMGVVAACEGYSYSEQADNRPTLVLEVRNDPERSVETLTQRLVPFGFRVVPVDAVELRDELAAQVTRRAGLSAVFRDLLDFGGNEIYLVDPPSSATTFQSVVTGTERSVILGLVRPGSSDEVDLWPAWDAPVSGAKLIVLASNASEAALPFAASEGEAYRTRPSSTSRAPQRQDLLMVGWNQGAAHLLEVLDQFAGRGSTVTIISGPTAAAPPPALDNMSITDMRDLGEDLSAWLDRRREDFDHAIVLSNDHKTAAASDADTLLTLLALRPPGVERGNPTTVVAQLCQRSNKYLAHQRLADDLIVGHSLTATVLSQLAVTPDLHPVLRELVGRTPSTLDTVPIEAVELEGDVTFAELSRLVAWDGEIALGWQTTRGGLVMNPPKSARVSAADLRSVVVLTRFAAPTTMIGHSQPAGVVQRQNISFPS